MILNFVEEDVYPIEGEVPAVDGDTLNITCIFLDASTVGSSAAAAYLGEEDVTATLMPSGSIVETDNTVTLKPITALTGENTYTVNVTTTLDSSDVRTKKILLNVANKKI